MSNTHSTNGSNGQEQGEPSTHEGLEVEWAPFHQVVGNPSNPRINEAAVDPVAASLKRYGQDQAVRSDVRRAGALLEAEFSSRSLVAELLSLPCLRRAASGVALAPSVKRRAVYALHARLELVGPAPGWPHARDAGLASKVSIRSAQSLRR